MNPLSLFSNATNLIRGITDTAKNMGRAEILSDLLDLQTTMLTLQQEAFQQLEENRTLKEQLAEAKRQIELQGQLEFHFDSYWRRLGENSLDGPFSMARWDDDKKLVRIAYYGDFVNDEGLHKVEFYCRDAKQHAYVPLEFIKANNVTGALSQLSKNPRRH